MFRRRFFKLMTLATAGGLAPWNPRQAEQEPL